MKKDWFLQKKWMLLSTTGGRFQVKNKAAKSHFIKSCTKANIISSDIK
jgi:hypothetical protein